MGRRRGKLRNKECICYGVGENRYFVAVVVVVVVGEYACSRICSSGNMDCLHNLLLFTDAGFQDGRRNGEGNSYAHDRHGYDRPHQYDTRPMYNSRPPYGRGGPSTEEDDRAFALALQEEERHSEYMTFEFLNFQLWYYFV